MRDVHHHGDRREITDDTNDVDDTAFCEFPHGAPIGRFGYSFHAKQFVAKLVGDFLVFAHLDRAPALGKRGDELHRQPGLAAERNMDEPFEMLRPLSRNDQHDEFAYPRLERTLKAQVLADLLQRIHQLGAAQQRDEGSLDAPARPGGQRSRGAALGLVHRRFLERRHAV